MVHLHQRASNTTSPSSSQLTDEKSKSRHRHRSLRHISSTLSAMIKPNNNNLSSSSSESSSTASSVLEDTKNKVVSRRSSVAKATLARLSDSSRLNKLLTMKSLSSSGESSESGKRRSWSGVLQGMKRRNSPPSLQPYRHHESLPPRAAIAHPPAPPSPLSSNPCTPSIISEDQEQFYHPCDTAAEEPFHVSMKNSDPLETRSNSSSSSSSSNNSNDNDNDDNNHDHHNSSPKMEEQQPAVAEDPRILGKTTMTAPTPTVQITDEKPPVTASPSPPPPPPPVVVVVVSAPYQEQEKHEPAQEPVSERAQEPVPEVAQESVPGVAQEAVSEPVSEPAAQEPASDIAAPVGVSLSAIDASAAVLQEHLGRTSALELGDRSRIETVLTELVGASQLDAHGFLAPAAAVPLFFGSTVGTTVSHDQCDLQGNRSTIVTGYCLVTEPERVPKSLILDDDYDQAMLASRVTTTTTTALMRLRYICHVGHADATTKFAKCPSSEWVPDQDVQGCQHKTCLHTFGFFMRRHHCRSCGHIFCYKHSANQLALFDARDNEYSNSRVCDGCLYRLLQ